MRVLIVGGVAGGASAAARIRRLDETAEIVIFERSEYISYANCGLPYYIGDKITRKSDLTLNTPEGFKKRFNVDVRVESEVTEVDTKKHQITVKNLTNGEVYTEQYDKLLLSPGAKAVRSNVEGANRPEVFVLRTVRDTFEIKEYINKHNPKTAVIAGGGYIGLEMAENLSELGIKVTLVQRPSQVMPPLDWDMAGYLQGYIRTCGIELKLSSALSAITEENGKVYTVIGNGEKIQADIIIMAIGVSPDTEFIKNSGIDLGMKNAIKVNEKMETSAPDVYAAGDAVEVKNFVTGATAVIPLAGPANKQGRIAADNICGGIGKFEGTQGSSVIKVFDITVATTGINEKQAKQAGLDFDKVVLCPPSHASYYPEASNIAMKIIYEKHTGKLFGAQLIGFEGVDKRCDVLAVAVKFGLTAFNLTEMELCYAPPYSSAKDPVNMAGYVMQNIIEGKIKQIYVDEVDGLDRKAVVMLDVRNPGEFSDGHFEGAINIPLDSLRGRAEELPKDKPIYVNCKTGLRSYIACRMLMQMGFDCINIAGGFYFYANVMMGAFDMAALHGCGIKIE